jgi:iron complex transport system ATP-binding protein
MIDISGISYAIGKSQILKDVTLNIPRGQITALIGPNGAGKSSLLNLMSGQELLQTGKITVDGLPIDKAPSRDLALKMAVLAQQVGVASRLRIKDLIGFGRWPHNQGRPTEADHAMIAQAMTRFDLDKLADRFLDEVSGGQRQRAFVAMAYAQDTDWLLLDEPLNNLDLRYARSLMAELHRLAYKKSKSIVIVLHDLNYAMAWANHIVAIKNGAVAFSGVTQDVATARSLSTLYDTDLRLIRNGQDVFVAHHR